MANVTNRLGSWNDEQIVCSVRRDDGTGVINRVILVNNAAQPCRFRAYKYETPQDVREVVVQPGTTDTYNVPAAAGWWYFPEEPAPDEPASNFGFSLAYPA